MNGFDLSLSPGLIATAAVLIVLGFILLRFARQIAVFLLIVGVLGVVIVLAVALLGQADATRHTAMATQRAATAATVASAGQTAGTFGLNILVLLLVVAVVVIGYLALRLRQAEAAGRRTSAPSALWARRTGHRSQAMLPPPAYYPPPPPPYPYGYGYPQPYYQQPQPPPVFAVQDDDTALDALLRWPWEEGDGQW